MARGKKAENDEKIEACKKYSLYVAHKVRNPLSALLNILYQLKKQPGLGKDARELLFILDEEIYQLRLVCDELSLFSKKSVGETCLLNVSTLLNQFKRDFLKECVLADKDTLEIDVEDPRLSFDFHPHFFCTVLKTIVFNLLVKAEEKQKIKITACSKGKNLVIFINSLKKLDLGMRKNGIDEILASGEEKVVTNLSLALVEHCISEQAGTFSIKEGKNETMGIELTLPLKRRPPGKSASPVKSSRRS